MSSHDSWEPPQTIDPRLLINEPTEDDPAITRLLERMRAVEARAATVPPERLLVVSLERYQRDLAHANARSEQLEQRLTTLETTVAELRRVVGEFRQGAVSHPTGCVAKSSCRRQTDAADAGWLHSTQAIERCARSAIRLFSARAAVGIGARRRTSMPPSRRRFTVRSSATVVGAALGAALRQVARP